jgi:hypothetical protein
LDGMEEEEHVDSSAKHFPSMNCLIPSRLT